MQRQRRIAAYGLCRDDAGKVIMVRGAAGYADAGRWSLPGGGLEHGEHPIDALMREFHEETGLRVAVGRPREILVDVERLIDLPALRHHDRIVFDVSVVGGHLRDERDGSSDHAAWVPPESLATLRLAPYAARALGVGSPPAPDVAAVAPVDGAHDGRRVPARVQRFAAYGLVADPTGNVLLTLIADGYPGAGLWHLPGGGTDFGEAAADGLLRELIEETDQRARVTELIGVSHRHHRDALGPEGVPIDWHGVRVVFRAAVDTPTPPRVMEGGGSTAAARWFSPATALRLPLTEIARDMISSHRDHAGVEITQRKPPSRDQGIMAVD